MQAIILLVFFGFLSALVGGYVNSGIKSSVELRDNLITEQEQIFNNISSVVTNGLVATQMESPKSTSSNSSDLRLPSFYVCQEPLIKQLVTCKTIGGKLHMVDVWGRQILGRVYRENAVDIHTQTGNALLAARAPVTGYLLVSRGPDGLLDARLQADLNNVVSANGIGLRDLASIQAYKTSNPGPGASSTDDMVFYFNDQEAQQRNFDEAANAVGQIAASVSRYYQEQFEQEVPHLRGSYGDFFTGSGGLDEAELNRWKASSSVSFLPLNTTDRDKLSIEDYVNTLDHRGITVSINATATDNVQIRPTFQPDSSWRLTGGVSCVNVYDLTCSGQPSCPTREIGTINCVQVIGGS